MIIANLCKVRSANPAVIRGCITGPIADAMRSPTAKVIKKIKPLPELAQA